jgi:hypothetical protein
MRKLTAGTAIMASFLGGVVAPSAIAQNATSPSPAAAPTQQAASRNEKVCENITVTGSRLGTKRFCGTRAEWEERKRRDREAVEAAQRSPCVISTTGASGKPSC